MGESHGDEFGHTYGQESHNHDCETTCNLMDHWPDGLDFWLTEYTKIEIWTEYYFDDDSEWDGLNPS